MSARDALYQLVGKWEKQARTDQRDQYPYQTVLDELLFHSELRFKDYIQFRAEGEFPARLQSWLENFSDDTSRKALFKLLRWLVFIDRGQMLSLYRDAYRRIIIRWLFRGPLSADELLDPNYEANIISRLRQYQMFAITESFSFPDFTHINDLRGLPKPMILGEDKAQVEAKKLSASARGAIVLEDFVGTGKQASGVIAQVQKLAAKEWELLFVPMVALEQGVKKLEEELNPLGITIAPVMVIPRATCVPRAGTINEPREFRYIRSLVERTSGRVLERYGPDDDPPNDPFGYRDCGALVVTCHNAPNNSLPLIHHRAPQWNPLFRRIHHSEDHS